MQRSMNIILLVISTCPVYAPAEPAVKPAAAVRFEAVEVDIDSGDKPLAVYQLELLDPTHSTVIVGIEGGEHAAFAKPPYYDPAALSRNRVIIAAFNTGNELPTGKKLLFICAQGARSGLACEMAAAMGIDSENLFNVEDGTATWIEKGNPTSYGSDS